MNRDEKRQSEGEQFSGQKKSWQVLLYLFICKFHHSVRKGGRGSTGVLPHGKLSINCEDSCNIDLLSLVCFPTLKKVYKRCVHV